MLYKEFFFFFFTLDWQVKGTLWDYLPCTKIPLASKWQRMGTCLKDSIVLGGSCPRGGVWQAGWCVAGPDIPWKSAQKRLSGSRIDHGAPRVNIRFCLQLPKAVLQAEDLSSGPRLEVGRRQMHLDAHCGAPVLGQAARAFPRGATKAVWHRALSRLCALQRAHLEPPGPVPLAPWLQGPPCWDGGQPGALEKCVSSRGAIQKGKLTIPDTKSCIQLDLRDKGKRNKFSRCFPLTKCQEQTVSHSSSATQCPQQTFNKASWSEVISTI